SLPSRSICCTRGRTSAAANPATASRNIVSSSDRMVNGALTSDRSVGMWLVKSRLLGRVHERNAGAKRDQLAQLFVDAERLGHTKLDVRMRARRVGHETRNVTRDVLARREHVWERDHFRRAAVDTRRESLLDRRLGKLHVRVAHQYVVADHLLEEIRGRAEHPVGLVPLRAVVDDENRAHIPGIYRPNAVA